jgi:hypothetical protein
MKISLCIWIAYLPQRPSVLMHPLTFIQNIIIHHKILEIFSGIVWEIFSVEVVINLIFDNASPDYINTISIIETLIDCY